MKILFIGDPHIKTDNGDDIDILLLEIRRITSDEKYDAIIVGGDVMHYHERLFTPALNKSLLFIDTLRTIAKTYVMVGNHDAINNSIFLTDQHWMNALKSWSNVIIVDDVVDEKQFVLCPYVPPGRLIEALETKMERQEWTSKKIIFAHQEIRGCRMGAILSTEGDEWLPSYPQLISGHIHDHQHLGENVHYPGTPLQHSFGDSDTRVLTKIEITDYSNDTVIVYLPITVPRKAIIKSSIATISSAISLIDSSTSINHHLKIKIKMDATTAEFSAFKNTKEYTRLIEKGVKIQLQSRPDQRKDTEDIVDIVDIDHKNFQEVLEGMIEDDEAIVKSLYDEIILEKIVLYSE
jgi:DNA repair exonuclease SbcCD nuclease subunit